jgi:hypothetical protein
VHIRNVHIFVGALAVIALTLAIVTVGLCRPQPPSPCVESAAGVWADSVVRCGPNRTLIIDRQGGAPIVLCKCPTDAGAEGK